MFTDMRIIPYCFSELLLIIDNFQVSMWRLLSTRTSASLFGMSEVRTRYNLFPPKAVCSALVWPLCIYTTFAENKADHSAWNEAFEQLSGSSNFIYSLLADPSIVEALLPEHSGSHFCG